MQEENAHNSAPGTKKPPCLGRLFYPKLAEWRRLATSRLGGYGQRIDVSAGVLGANENFFQ